jgi:hypothetical protein
MFDRWIKALLACFSGTSVAGCSETTTESAEARVVVMDPREGCLGIESTLDSYEELTPLGYSVDEVAAEVFAEYGHRFEWLPETGPVYFAGGSRTHMGSVTIVPAGGVARYIESSECAGNVSCPLGCLSRVDIEAIVSFSVSDGTFDEDWPLRVGVFDLGEFVFVRELDLSRMSGSLNPESFAIESEWTTQTFRLEGLRVGGEMRGLLEVEAVAPDGMLWYGGLARWGNGR